MAKFHFREGFWLLVTGGGRFRYEKGIQDVPDEHADHWYVLSKGERVDQDADKTAKDTGENAEVDDADTTMPVDENEDDASTSDDGDEDTESDDEDSTESDDDEDTRSPRERLVDEAESLGITIDKRWGVTRLKTEIDLKRSAK